MLGLVRIIVFLVSVLVIGVMAVVHMPGTPNEARASWYRFEADGRSIATPDGFVRIDPFDLHTRYLGVVWSHFAPPSETRICLLAAEDLPIELFLYVAPKSGFEPLVKAAVHRYDDHLNVTRQAPMLVTTQDGVEVTCHVVRKTDPVHPEGNVTLLLAIGDLGDRMFVANGGGRSDVVDMKQLLDVVRSARVRG